MSRASEARRQAIRLVDALKREGHDCTIEIDNSGMPLIHITEQAAAQYITFEIELGDIARPSGGTTT